MKAIKLDLILTSIATGAAAFLFGLTYGLICPAVQPDSTSAESSTSASSTITASSDPIISISTPDSVNLSITPNFESSVFTTASATVTVSTNNAYGYTLSMGTSGTDSSGNASTALIHSNGASTIPTLSADTAATTFSSTSDTTTNNMWGYTLDDTTYSPLTTSSDPAVIKTTETTANADTTTVTFGTKTTSDQPSGDYTNTVVFSATANPQKLTIFDIDDMQEMTTDVCANTTTPDGTALSSFDEDGSHKGDTAYIPQTTLTDTRDNKVYAVRKLADGNCWMVQNLALGTSTALSSDDTNIESTSTYTMPTSSGGSFSSSNYDANELVEGAHIDGYIATPQTDLSSTGNWYSWYAATAGTGTYSLSAAGADAASSICPKGWRLPTGYDSSNGNEFSSLYTAYSSTYASLDSVFPLTLTGQYYSGSLDYSGSYGFWWSSTAFSSYSAHFMSTYSSSVYPSDYYHKYYGRPVRCIAGS